MTAVDDDLLVPIGELLLGLFERVPRLPPLLRQVYLLFRGKEVVQLFEREGVRVDAERPHRAAVLGLAADNAEPLVDALMLRVLPFPRCVLVPHPVGQAVLHVLQQALGVRVEVGWFLEDVIQVDVVTAQDDVVRLGIVGVIAAAVVKEVPQGAVILTVEVENQGAHLALRVGGVCPAPVGKPVRYRPVRIAELGKSVLERVLEQDAAANPVPFELPVLVVMTAERADDDGVRLVLTARLPLGLDEPVPELKDIGVDIHGRDLGSPVFKKNGLKRQSTHQPIPEALTGTLYYQ